MSNFLRKGAAGLGQGLAKSGEMLLADALETRRQKAIAAMQQEYGLKLEDVRAGNEMARTKLELSSRESEGQANRASEERRTATTTNIWEPQYEERSEQIPVLDPLTGQTTTKVVTTKRYVGDFNRGTGTWRVSKGEHDRVMTPSPGADVVPKMLGQSPEPSFYGSTQPASTPQTAPVAAAAPAPVKSAPTPLLSAPATQAPVSPTSPPSRSDVAAAQQRLNSLQSIIDNGKLQPFQRNAAKVEYERIMSMFTSPSQGLLSRVNTRPVTTGNNMPSPATSVIGTRG